MACSQFPRRQQPDRLLSTIGLKESVKPLIDKWNTINVLNPFITCNSERLIHISVSIDGFYSRPNTTMVNGVHIKKKISQTKQNKWRTALDNRHSQMRKWCFDPILSLSLSFYVSILGANNAMLFDHRVWLERQPPHKQQFSEYPKQIYRLLCFACYRNIFCI